MFGEQSLTSESIETECTVAFQERFLLKFAHHAFRGWSSRTTLFLNVLD